MAMASINKSLLVLLKDQKYLSIDIFKAPSYRIVGRRLVIFVSDAL